MGSGRRRVQGTGGAFPIRSGGKCDKALFLTIFLQIDRARRALSICKQIVENGALDNFIERRQDDQKLFRKKASKRDPQVGPQNPSQNLVSLKQKEKGIKVIDIAKALLDYGFHSPTIYFPNNVPEAMMIEPTESETLETLNRFADTMLEINEKINNCPDFIRQAPINTPVTRLDETKANRELDLKWTP